MIEWGLAASSVVCFVVLLWALKVVERGREVLRLVESSIDTLRDAELDEIAKETAIQTSSVRLIKLFGILTASGFICVIAPMVLIWGIGLTGMVDPDEVIRRIVSPSFLIGSAIAGVALAVVLERLRAPRSAR